MLHPGQKSGTEKEWTSAHQRRSPPYEDSIAGEKRSSSPCSRRGCISCPTISGVSWGSAPSSAVFTIRQKMMAPSLPADTSVTAASPPQHCAARPGSAPGWCAEGAGRGGPDPHLEVHRVGGVAAQQRPHRRVPVERADVPGCQRRTGAGSAGSGPAGQREAEAGRGGRTLHCVADVVRADRDQPVDAALRRVRRVEGDGAGGEVLGVLRAQAGRS